MSQWCQIENETVVTAPGAKPAAAVGDWRPVVDMNARPDRSQYDADEQLVVFADRVERTWANVRQRTDVANDAAIVSLLGQRLDDLVAYVALPTPTAAQTTAVVKLLCRLVAGLIRRHLGRLDAAP